VTKPDIITPNGDGFNDKWILGNISNFPDCKVKITKAGLFNSTVFESTGYSQPWDGSHNGHYSDGKYKYEITFTNTTYTGCVCVYGTGNVEIDDFDCLDNCFRADTNDPLIN
jgi:gliding motility-associated-like protein